MSLNTKHPADGLTDELRAQLTELPAGTVAALSGRAPADVSVVVGMSGGVDSSLTAAILQAQGFKVTGLFMKNWEEDDGTEYCTAMDDLADAQSVCDALGLTLKTANFSSEYWDHVFEHFLEEYHAGRTPNPDILCNKEIKFKAFLDYAEHLGADFIATGHYARRGAATIVDGALSAPLLRGLDPAKDQSYFLHAVSGEKLAKTLFPLGEFVKTDVRKLAAALELSTAKKKDSTGICFIGERKFSDFLKTYVPAQAGDIVSDDGTKIGRHTGLLSYTLGQRGGIGVGGVKGYPEAPWFVLQKNLEQNVLKVGQGHDHPLLMSQSLVTRDVDWVQSLPVVDGLSLADGIKLTAKVRYRQGDQGCTVNQVGDEVRVVFDEPQRAVTPGQSVVFYNGDVCLGGGVIENTN